MLSYRFANRNDIDLYFRWANDKASRENSYNPAEISYEQHVNWFNKRVGSEDCYFYLFLDEQDQPVGQVRIERNKTNTEAPSAIISISVDERERGKGYSKEMISIASEAFLRNHPGYKIFAYIFRNNKASYAAFIKANYQLLSEQDVNGKESYILYLQ